MLERFLQTVFLGSMASVVGIFLTLGLFSFLLWLLSPMQFSFELYLYAIGLVLCLVAFAIVMPSALAIHWWRTRGRFGVSLF